MSQDIDYFPIADVAECDLHREGDLRYFEIRFDLQAEKGFSELHFGFFDRETKKSFYNRLIPAGAVKIKKDGDIMSNDGWDVLNVTVSEEETEHLIVPYDTSGPEIKLWFKFDATDKAIPFATYYKHTPLNILAFWDKEDSANKDKEPIKLSVALSCTDCESVISALMSVVDANKGDLTNDDVNFIKGILDSSNDTCMWNTDEFDTPTPPDPAKKVSDYISSLDKLICYLKDKVIKYKTELAAVGAGSDCYKMVPCLVKSLVSLRKIYVAAKKSYNQLYVAYLGLAAAYQELANDNAQVISDIKNITYCTTDFITNNIDPNFDLSKVTCTAKCDKYKGDD